MELRGESRGGARESGTAGHQAAHQASLEQVMVSLRALVVYAGRGYEGGAVMSCWVVQANATESRLARARACATALPDRALTDSAGEVLDRLEHAYNATTRAVGGARVEAVSTLASLLEQVQMTNDRAQRTSLEMA